MVHSPEYGLVIPLLNLFAKVLASPVDVIALANENEVPSNISSLKDILGNIILL